MPLVGDGGKKKIEKFGTYLQFMQKFPNNKHKHSKGLVVIRRWFFHEIWKKSWGEIPSRR
jgi:hypothetical protein